MLSLAERGPSGIRQAWLESTDKIAGEEYSRGDGKDHILSCFLQTQYWLGNDVSVT
jgi:hypothetical protein